MIKLRSDSLRRYTVILLALVISIAELVLAQDTTNIVVNIADTGRTFDGVGGLSGGGGTSRLLWDYPPQQRNKILDYLFKPDYGASLQILKVEIGCDANSTNGAEASHMRTPTDSNFNRGYEWWLMEQAKLRNPNIKLYGLEWGAPGWFNGGFWSQDNINYIISWIKHAWTDHQLHIDYIGGWNESGWNKTWFENLKKAIISNGLTTKVVAADNSPGWNVAADLISDTAFRSAVDIIGLHYPCGWMQPEKTCSDPNYTTEAENLNMPIWASESGSQNYDNGALPLARALNRDYIDSRITAYINWTVVAAWYSTLPYFGDGLMLASTPWSGYYKVGKSIWVTAQTAQFVQPGWSYIDSACGYLGGNRNNGSFVTLKSTDGKDYSIIIETVDASGQQTANFSLAKGTPTSTVHVWSTNLNSSNESDYFVEQNDMTPDSGKYSITLKPGFVYTLSTTSGQAKGITIPPSDSIMKLPYTENFEADTLGQIPKYFDSIQGAFEVDSCRGGRIGMCMRQQITIPPIMWGGGSPTAPLAVMGDPDWTNYQVSMDALIEQSGYVDLIGRLNAQSQSNGASQGYHLRISSAGSWILFKENLQNNDAQLGAGSASIGLNSWHRLSLWFKEDTIKAFLDSTLLTTAVDNSYFQGQIGVLVSKWQNAEFDNFIIIQTDNVGGITVDDAIEGSGYNEFNYVGNGWQHCSGCGSELYDATNSWDNVAGDYVTVKFSGTQIKFYGVKDPKHGIGAVSIDGGPETNIDFYAAVRAGNQLMWTSPILADADHVFKIRVTGTKNPSSSDYFVVPDRVVIFSSSTAGVKETSVIPEGYYLFQNHPNPFNPTTVISFQIPVRALVSLKIYDELGRETATLINNEFISAGKHEINFDASRFSSGVYFFELRAGSFTDTKKMIILK